MEEDCEGLERPVCGGSKGGMRGMRFKVPGCEAP